MQKDVKQYYINLGEKIKNRRKELGYTQEDVAYMMGADRKHISQIEKGSQNMTFQTFFRICEVLKMDPIELFAGIKENNLLNN